MRVGIDVETTGLDPRSDRLVLVSIHDGERSYVVDATHPQLPDTLRYYYDRAEIVCHNASFDLTWLDLHLGVGIPQRIFDTMVAEILLTSGQQVSRSLAETSLRRLGVLLDKGEQLTLVEGGAVTQAVIDYARRDVEVLLPLAATQEAAIVATNQQTPWQIEKLVTPVYVKMERDGIRVEVERLREIVEVATSKRDQLQRLLEERLSKHVEWQRVAKYDEARAKRDEYQQLKDDQISYLRELWQGEVESETREGTFGDTTPHATFEGWAKGEKRYVDHWMKWWRQENKLPSLPKLDVSPINLNSPQQVLAAFQALGVEIANTDAATLRGLLPEADPVFRDEVLQPFLDYRKQEKIVTTYGDRLLAKVVGERVYPHFNQIGTATGRPSSSGPNLLNIPQDSEDDPEYRFRRCFLPDPGHLMIVADYSQMELRILGELSQDPLMLDAFHNGRDIHTERATQIFGKEVTKDRRHVAKTLNFGMAYGMGARKLAVTVAERGIYFTLQEAKAIINTVKEESPGIFSFLDRTRDQAEIDGYVTTPLGRRRYLDFTAAEGIGDRIKLRNEAGNHPIQGGNADITKLAMIIIDHFLRPLGGRVVLNVYDEIVSSVPQKYTHEGLAIVTTAMKVAAETVLKTVPIEVDGVISTSWSEYDGIGEKVWPDTAGFN